MLSPIRHNKHHRATSGSSRPTDTAMHAAARALRKPDIASCILSFTEPGQFLYCAFNSTFLAGCLALSSKTTYRRAFASLPSLQLACDSGLRRRKTNAYAKAAAICGKPEVLQLAINQALVSVPLPWFVYTYACKKHNRLLQDWLCGLARPNRSVGQNHLLVASATSSGSLDSILWALSFVGYASPPQWDTAARRTIIEPAAKHGHIHVLEWLGMPVCDTAAAATLYAAAFSAAALANQKAVLVWLRTVRQCPWPEKMLYIHRCQLDVVQWLYAQGCCHIHMKLAVAAAKKGELAKLRWMKSAGIGGDWIGDSQLARCLCYAAIGWGEPNVLKWLKEENVGPWDHASVQAMIDACDSTDYDSVEETNAIEEMKRWLTAQLHTM